MGAGKDSDGGISSAISLGKIMLGTHISLQCLDYLFEIAVKMKMAGLPVVAQP
jgi:hypothetical protein